MSKEYLFDFYLFHAYSKLGGFLVNILGLAVAFVGIFRYIKGKSSPLGCVLYLLAAFAFLAYTPITLKIRAARAMKIVDAYRKPMDMIFSEEDGITTVQGEKKHQYSWDQILRGVVTPKTIALYISSEDALVIPKVDFGKSFQPIFLMITRHLGAGRMRIR